MQLDLAFDLDMTLNNMAYTWADWLRANFDKNYTTQKSMYHRFIYDAYGNAADDYWRDPACYDKIEPLAHAKTFISQLILDGHRIKIITHTPPGQSRYVKNAWVKKHFGDIKVIHAEKKYEHSANCIFVDDHPGHVQRHVRYNPGHYGVVFNHNDNYGWANPLLPGPNVIKVTTYAELLQIINTPESIGWKFK